MNIINFVTDCFELYELMLQPIWKKHGLTKIELDILLFLDSNPGYDTAADIIEIRKLTKSHVSAAVKKLCKKKMLEKVFFNNNKKSQHLKILPAAEAIIKDGKVVQKQFFEDVFKGMSIDEIKVLKDFYDRLENNIQNRLAFY